MSGTHEEVGASVQAKVLGDQRRTGSIAMLSKKLSDAERILALSWVSDIHRGKGVSIGVTHSWPDLNGFLCWSCRVAAVEGSGEKILSREVTWSDPGFPRLASLSASRGMRKALARWWMIWTLLPGKPYGKGDVLGLGLNCFSSSFSHHDGCHKQFINLHKLVGRREYLRRKNI